MAAAVATPRPLLRRIQALDALRGLTALSVVLYHCTLRYPNFIRGAGMSTRELFPGFTEVEAGTVPVLFFFLISGFVITWTVDRCRTPMDFIVSRFSRLYPAYWASILITILAVTLWPLPNIAIHPGYALANLTMLQEYLQAPHLAGVYWSLTVEITFYAYALALFALGWWRFVHLAAFAWAALALVAALFARQGLDIPWRLHQALLLYYAPFLVAGMMLYQLWRRNHPAWTAATLVLCVTADFTIQPPVSATLCVAVMALIAASTRGYLEWLATSPLLWLGSISYSLYLVHEYPSYITIRALDSVGAPHWAAIATAIAIVLAIATAISYAVERPAMRAIRTAWLARHPNHTPQMVTNILTRDKISKGHNS